MSRLVRGCSAGLGWRLSPIKQANQWSVVLSCATTSRNNNNCWSNKCDYDNTNQSRRSFSSREGGGRQQSGFQLDALTFSISPEEALAKFQKWATDDQGLNYLMSWNSIRVGAAYTPVWSFDLNIRFAVTDSNGKKRYDWKPSVFSGVYSPSQSVIHLPGLASYAGYNYRRKLVHPIVNTTLVFMGEEAVPFEKFMLRDMKLQSNGERIEVVPDPWNATRAQAFATLVEDLENLSADADGKVEVQTEILKSRRVYIPVYVIDYSILGIEYRAFTSGCDKAAGVSGVDHRVFGDFRGPSHETNQASQSFLSNTWAAAQSAAQVGLRTFNGRQIFTVVAIALQFFGSILVRLAMRIPVLAFFGSIFVGFRKIISPFLETRRSKAEWEHQREQEGKMDEGRHSYGDDFTDSGAAQRHYFRNREKILRYLGGVDEHESGDFDWYTDWQNWASNQWQQQQQQKQQQQQSYGDPYRQQQQQQQSNYRQQQRTQKQKMKPEYSWDFDPNDPYSVLNIRRGATKAEVSAAFRREMLKHHPDTQAGASEAEKLRASERSKHITEAYRTIKTSMKK